MDISLLASGFLVGIAGSLHCIGMCGPLSLALPLAEKTNTQKVICLLYYQLGRIMVYASSGCLFGLLGRGIYLSGYQQYFSIFLGSLFLLMAIAYLLRKPVAHIRALQPMFQFVLGYIVQNVQRVRRPISFFLLGMANGFLPCGLLFFSLMFSLSFTRVADGVVWMAMFGLGTVPAMLLIPLAGHLAGAQFRRIFKKVTPVFILAMGIFLILRGMNLGIPYISPQLPLSTGEEINCPMPEVGSAKG